VDVCFFWLIILLFFFLFISHAACCYNIVLRRFSHRVLVPLPDEEDRKAMLLLYLADVRHHVSEQDLLHLAQQTAGWSGSDLHDLVREAVLGPIHDLYEDTAHLPVSMLHSVISQTQTRAVTTQDFLQAMTLNTSATLFHQAHQPFASSFSSSSS
jgi:SpoVK/Ycf46/Vps4 family AAA+-type ATPase